MENDGQKGEVHIVTLERSSVFRAMLGSSYRSVHACARRRATR
jgi:hypothetical protein